MACGAAFEKGPPSPDSRLGAFRGQTCLPRVIYKWSPGWLPAGTKGTPANTGSHGPLRCRSEGDHKPQAKGKTLSTWRVPSSARERGLQTLAGGGGKQRRPQGCELSEVSCITSPLKASVTPSALGMPLQWGRRNWISRSLASPPFVAGFYPEAELSWGNGEKPATWVHVEFGNDQVHGLLLGDLITDGRHPGVEHAQWPS